MNTRRVLPTNARIMSQSSRKRPLPLMAREIIRKPTAAVDKMKAKQVEVITTWRKLSWSYPWMFWATESAIVHPLTTKGD